MEELTRHPLSALWGDMPEEQFADLVESVRTSGVGPIVRTLKGAVLDGWHRHQAALAAGVEPIVAEWHGSDPAAYVIKENALRRHLTPGQRAACIVACHEWRGPGRPKKPEPGSGSSEPPTEAQMAAEAGVSDRTVRDAKTAEKAGLGDAVRSGELSPKAAAAQARQQQAGPDAEPVPRPPTRTERLEAERDGLALDVEDKATRLDELEDQVRFHEGNMNEQEAERHKAYTALQAELSTARSQINEWMVKYNEELRSRKYWEHEAKRLGWAPSNGEKI